MRTLILVYMGATIITLFQVEIGIAIGMRDYEISVSSIFAALALVKSTYYKKIKNIRCKQESKEFINYYIEKLSIYKITLVSI